MSLTLVGHPPLKVRISAARIRESKIPRTCIYVYHVLSVRELTVPGSLAQSSWFILLPVLIQGMELVW